MVHRGEDDGAPRGGRWCTEGRTMVHRGEDDGAPTGPIQARPQFEATTVNRENLKQFRRPRQLRNLKHKKIWTANIIIKTTKIYGPRITRVHCGHIRVLLVL